MNKLIHSIPWLTPKFISISPIDPTAYVTSPFGRLKDIENENVSKTKLLIFLFEPAASAVFSQWEQAQLLTQLFKPKT